MPPPFYLTGETDMRGPQPTMAFGAPAALRNLNIWTRLSAVQSSLLADAIADPDLPKERAYWYLSFDDIITRSEVPPRHSRSVSHWFTTPVVIDQRNLISIHV